MSSFDLDPIPLISSLFGSGGGGNGSGGSGSGSGSGGSGSGSGGSGSGSGSGDGGGTIPICCWLDGATGENDVDDSGSSNGSGGGGSGSGSGGSVTAPGAAPDGSGAGGGTTTVPTTPPVARGGQSVNTLAPPGHNTYPTLPKTDSTEGQFYLQSDNYDLTVGGNILYVKGWIQFVIQLGATVPAATGGGNVINFGNSPGSFSGSDWRYAKKSLSSATGMSYWNGTAWADVPAAWSDPAHTLLYPIGIWKEGSANKGQLGLAWPENVPAWGPTQNALCSTTLPKWTSQIQTDWSYKWDLKRQDCPSLDTACCRYHPIIKVKFWEVSIVTTAGHTIVLAANNARSNAGAWSLGDARAHMPSHEFGHHLGYPDEYPGGVGVDTSVNDDGATAGIDPGSIMGAGMNADNTAVVKKRHFRVVGKQLALLIDAQTQRSNNYVFKAVPGVC